MRNFPIPIFALLTACAGSTPAPDAVTDQALVAYPTAAFAPARGPWERYEISGRNLSLGADGVDLVDVNGDGVLDIATAWEEGHRVTVIQHPPIGADPRDRLQWSLATWIPNAPGVEDARLAVGALDLDHDFALAPDLVAFSDTSKRIFVTLNRGDMSTFMTLPESLGHGNWMQGAIADVDGDGWADIVAGSRIGATACVGWFRNPGTTAGARDPAQWHFHQIGPAGWIMSVLVLDVDGDGDLDVFVTDRAKLDAGVASALGIGIWDRYGARWIEQTPGGWVNHAIDIAGNGTDPATGVARTPGDEMMASLYDWDGDGVLDLVECQSRSTAPNRIVVRRNTAHWGPPATWTTELVPIPDGVGHCQHVAAHRLETDGTNMIASSSWEADKLPASPLIGVYVLRDSGGGIWDAENVSGPEGTKYDNVVWYDVDGDGCADLVTSEQVGDTLTPAGAPQGSGQGVIWFRNPMCATIPAVPAAR